MRHSLFRILLCACGVAALLPHPTTAQVSAGSERILSEAVVERATALKTSAEAAPRQRIDSTAMRQWGITSTADALRRMAGVNLRDYGGAGGLKTVSVRGMGASHTVVTLDGLPVADARHGQIDLAHFRLEQLAALELHTADVPALLCPVRQLGAACLALTTWQSETRDTARLHGSAALTQASFGTWNPYGTLKYNTRRGTRLQASADYYRTRGDYPFTLRNGVLTHTERRTHSELQSGHATLALRRALSDSARLTASAGWRGNRQALPGPVRYYTNENHERTDGQSAFAQVRTDLAVRRMRLFAAAKYAWDESRYRNLDAQYPAGGLRQNYRTHTVYATAGAGWYRGRMALAAAADYEGHSMHSNLSFDADVWRNTWLGSLSLRYAAPRFSATARLAATWFRDHIRGASQTAAKASGTGRLSPTLTLAWRAVDRERTQLSARVYYKESFRAPTFTERYYYHYGNADLRPERSRQLGFGLTLRTRGGGWLRDVAATLDTYAGRIRDRITGIPVTLYVWRTVNLGRVRTAGADATLQAAVQPAARHRLILAANYTWLRTVDRTDPARAAYGKQLAYAPRHAGATSLAWENPWLGLVAGLTAAGDRWTTHEHAPTTLLPRYADCFAGIYRTFALGRTSLELRADMTNLAAKQYELVARYPMPGRAYKLTAKLSF